MGASSRLGPKDVDEYDPARPNDYEEYANERQARQQRREMERQQREQEREQQRGFQPSVPMDEDDFREAPRGSTHHRYSPPPQPSRSTRESSPPPSSAKLDLNVSGEEVHSLLGPSFTRFPFSSHHSAPSRALGLATAGTAERRNAAACSIASAGHDGSLERTRSVRIRH